MGHFARKAALERDYCCQTPVLVVEDNVGLPDCICRDSESLDAIELHRVPAQFIIIPDLKEINRSQLLKHFFER